MKKWRLEAKNEEKWRLKMKKNRGRRLEINVRDRGWRFKMKKQRLKMRKTCLKLEISKNEGKRFQMD